MKYAFLLLLLASTANAFEASTDFICDAQELNTSGDGREGSFAVSISAKGDSFLHPDYALSARWISERGYLAGPGMACGSAVPDSMTCVTSVSQVSSGKETYLRQSCGEPFSHFGGPYFPFDTGFNMNSTTKDGQFSCVVNAPGTSSVKKSLVIKLSNCR